ncbi:hypothetical protein KQX54_006704 [Cotesia glomerata]|uniref:Uncharacterized protein n=1 Tax=Cotesia glomerata TaxID=32391 RepID=A0AAV7J5E5_COTGL|nr:hypothetical protein KQX54_006704 [Cotesia glomerata]
MCVHILDSGWSLTAANPPNTDDIGNPHSHTERSGGPSNESHRGSGNEERSIGVLQFANESAVAVPDITSLSSSLHLFISSPQWIEMEARNRKSSELCLCLCF